MKETLIQKIRALLAKTMENGCTEQEALSAMEKAQEMMAKYEVSEEEVTQVKRETAEMLRNSKDDPNDIRRRLAWAIAAFTETDSWIESKGFRSREHNIVFCGLKADVEFADWLLDSLTMHVMGKLTDFLFSAEASLDVRSSVDGFVAGCVGRIHERLKNLRPQTGNAQALVVAKQALILQATSHLSFRSVKGNYRNGDGGAFQAGRRAGDAASFGQPVTGGVGQLRLGSQ